MNKEFDQIKQLIKEFDIEDQDVLEEEIINIRVMIQPQTLVQTYLLQTDVALIRWLNKNIK